MKHFFALSLLLCAYTSPAQLTNSGVYLNLATGTELNVQGGIQNNAGTIQNGGTLKTNGNISNAAAATLSGNGFYRLEGNWINAGDFQAGTSEVRFSGSANSQVTSGGDAFYKLALEKNAADLLLQDEASVQFWLEFAADNNQVLLGNHHLRFLGFSSPYNYDENEYCVTNGTGTVVSQSLGPMGFFYPVGADESTYNLMFVRELGTADAIGVRCLPSALTLGDGGPAITSNALNAAWEITEGVNGGSQLEVEANWSAADELPGFSRADCGVARYSPLQMNYDLPPANMGAATGSGPYKRTRTNVEPGFFTVADDSLMNRVLISLKIMLQGPFNTTSNQMNDNLRSASLLPTTAPSTYGAGKFAHSGWQPAGAYTAGAGVFAPTGNDAIVDWVFVWLKDTLNPAVNIQSRVALLQRDGDVVDLDGVSPLRVPANAGKYIVATGHRNHLSVRTPVGINLSESATTAYDFTSAQSQAFGTNPMKQVQSTPTAIFALWGGNVNTNNTVRATGPTGINDYSGLLNYLGTSTTVISNVYANPDLNMDGTVRATGPATINDYSRLLNILGTPTNIITEQQ